MNKKRQKWKENKQKNEEDEVKECDAADNIKKIAHFIPQIE